MIESTVTAKGQTTLPRAVRQSLDIGPGDRVLYLIVDGEVRLLKSRSVMELDGMLRRPGAAPRTLDEMEAGIAKGAIEGSR